MEIQTVTNKFDGYFCDLLKQMRFGESDLKKEKSEKKINVQPGKRASYEKSSESECGSENHEDIEKITTFSISQKSNQNERPNLERNSFAKS